MRRIAKLAASLMAVFFLFAGTAAHAQPAPDAPTSEEVSAFAASIDVNEDGSINVTERIDYFFPTPRHGIYRDIPTRYKLDDGRLVDVPVEVLDVTTPNDEPINYEVIRNKASLRIKIGSASSTVVGSQPYVITYSAVGALRYFSDHDELYWNVTGDAWTVPLRRVSADVRLPETVPQEEIRVRCFTGAAGSTATDCVAGVQGTTASFAANEALTIVTAWPPGLVAKVEAKSPSLLETLLPWTPLAIPLAVIGVLVLLWWTRGRDPEGKGTLVVQYDPPDGLTPAEVGVILDEDAGLKDVSAIIVDLAVRGYLKIREIEKQGLVFKDVDYEFEKLKEFNGDATLKPFEVHLLTSLFGPTGRIARVSDIKNNHLFYKDLPVIKQKLYDDMVAEGYFPSDPAKVRGAYAGVGLAIVIILAFFFPGVGFMFSGTFLGNTVLAVALSGVAILLFAPLMPRKTPKGVEAYEHACGFREYVDKAEKYRIEWQEKEGMFEKFLPYAMVFGVVEHWTHAFAGMNLPPPSWYEGRGWSANGFNTAAFYGSLNSMNSAMSTAMTSAPQKSSSGSGFGGGGGGGGGFGGGGGGSW
ncbi:MAG TPA: DUF2207 domain-containing protein [Candidatus Eisenbacteria bacterium]|nr:DUF2207 domain-containing protein [Candidatus Eisenbacteria bacterium]